MDTRKKTRKVGEVERRPRGKYHKERSKEYKKLKIEQETVELD